MKISRIDLWHVKVPLRAPFHPSWIPGFTQTENRFTLVRIATADGAEGWSAAPAMGRERAGLGQLLDIGHVLQVAARVNRFCNLMPPSLFYQIAFSSDESFIKMTIFENIQLKRPVHNRLDVILLINLLNLQLC